MEARKELGSFRRGEMSLTRKDRAGDQEVGSPRGGGNPLGQSPRVPRHPHPTCGTTAWAGRDPRLNGALWLPSPTRPLRT